MQNHTFKDYPAQSHIELRFSNRDQNLLEKEEALQNYRKNVYLLGKIFSIELEPGMDQDHQENNGQIEISEEQITKMQESLVQLKERYASRQNDFKNNNATYQRLLKEATLIKNQNQLNEFIQANQDVLSRDHPFLNPDSSFYLDRSDETIKEVIQIDALLLMKDQMANEQVIQL